MTRFVLDQLRHRPWRASTFALLVASSSVAAVLLVGAARTEATRVEGSVESNYRTAYDILVRPTGSRTPLERTRGLVRDNYLSGLFGGIPSDQLRVIRRIPHVEVAAPVANIGYFLPYTRVEVPLYKHLTGETQQLFRVSYTSLAHAGRSVYPERTEYVYFSRRPFAHEDYKQVEIVRGRSYRVCSGWFEGPVPPEPTSPFDSRPGMSCWSEASPEHSSVPGREVNTSAWTSPAFLVAAIDPVAEAALLGLDRTIVRGRYLQANEGIQRRRLSPSSRHWHTEAPMIASSRPYLDASLRIRIERVQLPRAPQAQARLASPDVLEWLPTLPRTDVATRTVPAAELHAGLADRGRIGAPLGWNYLTAAPTTYRVDGGSLRPHEVRNPLRIWAKTDAHWGDRWDIPPRANADVHFRQLFRRAGNRIPDESSGRILGRIPSFRVVGYYDPTRLQGFSELSRVPLETYYPPVLEPADDASRKALRGGRLLPTSNVGDYVAQPPLLLTTLEGMRPFLDPRNYSGATRHPISVIRVRVAGVRGSEDADLVAAVAAEIRRRTGLEVDVTAGSTPRSLTVRLPAGRFGRPPLVVREGWSQKGASLVFLDVLDRKTTLLAVLIPVLCIFVLVNGTTAIVRERRREIGCLLCVGWPRRSIFAAVLGEALAVGAIGAAAGALVAAVATLLFFDGVSPSLVATTATLALGLALVSSLVPAFRAAKLSPLAAVHPPVQRVHRSRRADTIVSMAALNVRRLPHRALPGVAAMAVGIAAFTILGAAMTAFSGSLIGTLLGEAISAQVRWLDFAAAGAVVGLSAFALAELLLRSVRERAAEFATLRSFGWREGALRSLVVLEALMLGLAGAVVGVALGLALGLALDLPFDALAKTALASVVGGLLVALAASLAPVQQLRRSQPARILAAE